MLAPGQSRDLVLKRCALGCLLTKSSARVKQPFSLRFSHCSKSSSGSQTAASDYLCSVVRTTQSYEMSTVRYNFRVGAPWPEFEDYVRSVPHRGIGSVCSQWRWNGTLTRFVWAGRQSCFSDSLSHRTSR
jgi:hypothetical protein